MSFTRLSKATFEGLLEAFQSSSPIYYRGKQLKSQVELLAVADFRDVFVDASLIHTARANKQALLFPMFEDVPEVSCPHCKTAMKPVKLIDQKGLFCPSCRHADYDPRVKPVIKAGDPSSERIMDLECSGDGNCRLK